MITTEVTLKWISIGNDQTEVKIIRIFNAMVIFLHEHDASCQTNEWGWILKGKAEFLVHALRHIGSWAANLLS